MKDAIASMFASVKRRIDKARLENREPNLLTSLVWAMRKLFPKDWRGEG